MLISLGLSPNMWEKSFFQLPIYNKAYHKKIGKTPINFGKRLKPNLEYLKVWGRLVMLLESKMRKIGFQTCDCIFIGYPCNNSYHRFLVIF